MENKKSLLLLIITGGLIGLIAIILMKLGNPPNMGICAACFLRDTAGALGLDNAAAVQYIRPEIIGFILGSFILTMGRREFQASGGSAPLLRFVIAFFVMIGALVFLGCPLRMVLRLAAGDLNALVGLAGFIVGIGIGCLFLNKGYSLGASVSQSKTNGLVMPVIAVMLLVFLLVRPAFILFSSKGPGSLHAPIWISLVSGLVIGAFVQRSRLCMSGGIRNVMLLKSGTLLSGYIAIFVVALIANLAVGNFNLGFENQPIAHTDFVWNFLGMALVGYGSILIGGCPLRQLVMAGEGNSDAAIAVLGFLIAGATAHNFGIAASPAGVPVNGQIAVITGFIVLSLIAAGNCKLFSSMKATA